MPKLKALVTGGAGFLGAHLVQQLLDSGLYDITILDLRDTGRCKAPVVVADLRVQEQVSKAVAGMDVVFHCATATPTGENTVNKQLMYSVNVDGTKNVIQACVEHKLTALVFTSSASVVFDGRPLHFVTEDHPYAAHPMDYYTQTKIMAEKLVLEANGRGGLLRTVALRPSAIFGEGDLVMVPTAIRQARLGKLKYIIGNGKNEIDWTYVGNVAQAHVDAAAALTNPVCWEKVAGRPFFITNQDPRRFWDMMGDLCEGLGYPRPHIHLPFLLVIVIAGIYEYLVRPLVRPFKELRSDFTVNRILIATTPRTFSSKAATEVLGYRPRVDMAEALRRTLKAFEHLRNDKQVLVDKAAAKKSS